MARSSTVQTRTSPCARLCTGLGLASLSLIHSREYLQSARDGRKSRGPAPRTAPTNSAKAGTRDEQLVREEVSERRLQVGGRGGFPAQPGRRARLERGLDG